MMIFQEHPNHGKHIAYTLQEAEANRKAGWKDVSEKEFFTVNKAKPAAEPEEPAKRKKSE